MLHRVHLPPPVAFFAPLLVSLGLLIPSLAASKEPCYDLPDESPYWNLTADAIEAYQQEDFATSVEKNEAALEICDEDRLVRYNLARAYQKWEQCPMALIHYDILNESLKKLPRKVRKKVKKHHKAMIAACGETLAPINVTCADEGVEFTIEGFRTLACPYRGALEAGTITVNAQKPEHKPFSGTFELQPFEDNQVEIPALVPEAWFGQLSVTCSPNVAFFFVSGPDGDDKRACPWEGEVGVGTYTVTAEGADPITVEVVGMGAANAHLDVPLTPFARGGFIVGARAGTGLGYFSGDLTGDEANNESGEGASLGSLELVLDVGYALDEEWAILGRFRVDHDLGMAGGLAGRMTYHQKDDTALAASLGILGGSMKQPVHTDDDRTLFAEAGPVFFLIGNDFQMALSDVLAFTAGIDLYLDVVDGVSLQTDIQAGVEARF